MRRNIILGLVLCLSLDARRFYEDDPLPREPKPLRVEKAKRRKLNEYYDFFYNTFATPGEKQTPERAIPAQAVNTLGEVPDSAWYTNRHGSRPMSIQELRRGPGDSNGPSAKGRWKVVDAKVEGITPGFTIEDSNARRYLLKFDPPSNPEMASAADVIGAKFFYACGYNVPENYVVHFERKQLAADPKSSFTDAFGKKRPMAEKDLDEILANVPQRQDGKYRAMASLFLAGELLGPFRFHGVRRDDSNDVVLHEHRRDLRGLYVFAAWLGHNDIKSLNSLDALVEHDGLRYIKHYLIDFGAAFGSDSFTAKSPRAGHEYLFDFQPALARVLTLGLYVPGWSRAHYPAIPAVGRFEFDRFDPDKWKPNYPNPAFENRLPDDTFWAAKQVMAFRNEEIRALVGTGEFTDPAAAEWLTRTLIHRRNKIGKTYLSKVLPLDRFAVRDGRLQFEDLEVKHGFLERRQYGVRWFRFHNDTEQRTPLPGRSGSSIPPELRQAASGDYFAAEIESNAPGKTVTVYLRKKADRIEVVGVERTWPGKPSSS